MVYYRESFELWKHLVLSFNVLEVRMKWIKETLTSDTCVNEYVQYPFMSYFHSWCPRGKIKVSKWIWKLSNLAFQNLCAMLVDIWEHCTIGKYSLWSMNCCQENHVCQKSFFKYCFIFAIKNHGESLFQMNLSVF